MDQLEFPPEEPLRAELVAFIDSIQKRTPSTVDAWAGFDAVRVVEAAQESAQTGEWIDIANDTAGRSARPHWFATANPSRGGQDAGATR